MILRSISLKGIVGAEQPVSVGIDPSTTRLSLSPRVAGALPAVVMSLLFPDEVSATDIARIAGPNADSAWRVEFESAGIIFRVSRGFAPTSVVLDLKQDGVFNRAAVGSSDVRVKLGELIKLPAPTVMETLNFWINVEDVPEDSAAASSTGDADASGIVLVGTDDFLGGMTGQGKRERIPLQPEERAIAADEFRKNVTIEFLEDQIRQAEGKLEATIEKLGALVDSSGQMARITRELSNVPEMRELTPAERDAFADPDGQRDELERRLEAVDGELGALQSRGNGAARPRKLWLDPLVLVGVIATLVLTVLSLVGGPPARRFALGNVVSLAFALTGFMGWVSGTESTGRSSRKAQALERRRAQLDTEAEQLKRVVETLRDELPVRDLAAYDEAVEERQRLNAELDGVRNAHKAAFETEAYKAMAAKKDRAEARLDAFRAARRRLGEESMSSYELINTLESAGVDPWAVLWRPDPPQDELKRRVKRLGQVASKYRLISESGLNPKTIKSWLRVAERITGTELPQLNLTPDHQLVDESGAEVIGTMEHSVALAVVEALRMSLHLTLVKANAPGIHRFAIDVHPDRVADAGVRDRLDRMYTGLGERLQVVVTTAA